MPRSCRTGTTRSMKLSRHSGTTVRERLKPSTSASVTQAISWSATCSGEPTRGRLAAAQHEPVDQPALRPARAKRSCDGLYIGTDCLGITRLDHAVAGKIDAERGCRMY